MAVPEVEVPDEEPLMLMQMLVLMSALEGEDEHQEVAWAVGCQVVV